MVSQSPPCINRPPWRQLIDWIIDPLEVQDRCSQMYGDIFTMQLGKYRPVAIIGNPKAIQEIFTLDAKQFDIGRANALAEPLVGRNSLMLLDGDHHRRERKLLMPPFYRQAVQTYAQQICLITEQVASQQQMGQPFAARTAMQKISLEVILQIVFGISKGERYEQLKPLLIDWLNMTDLPWRSIILFLQFLQQNWGRWTPWGQIKWQQRQIHNLLQAEI